MEISQHDFIIFTLFFHFVPLLVIISLIDDLLFSIKVHQVFFGSTVALQYGSNHFIKFKLNRSNILLKFKKTFLDFDFTCLNFLFVFWRAHLVWTRKIHIIKMGFQFSNWFIKFSQFFIAVFGSRFNFISNKTSILFWQLNIIQIFRTTGPIVTVLLLHS